MKRRILLIAIVGMVVFGLSGCSKPPPPPPPTIDAPKLAAAFKWLGVCGVICSALGAAGLIIASHNRRK